MGIYRSKLYIFPVFCSVGEIRNARNGTCVELSTDETACVRNFPCIHGMSLKPTTSKRIYKKLLLLYKLRSNKLLL